MRRNGSELYNTQKNVLKSPTYEGSTFPTALRKLENKFGSEGPTLSCCSRKLFVFFNTRVHLHWLFCILRAMRIVNPHETSILPIGTGFSLVLWAPRRPWDTRRVFIAEYLNVEYFLWNIYYGRTFSLKVFLPPINTWPRSEKCHQERKSPSK